MTRILAVGEAMVEFAPVGDGLYRRGFAGDTLNTAWHLAHLLGSCARIGYVTRVGRDALSQQFVAFLDASGLDATGVQRDDARAMGLYLISLQGAERSFSYWRDASAARGLADDPAALRAAFAEAAWIHVSGITLGVIGETGRRHLIAALGDARRAGAKVSFDPNVRMRLWPDAQTLRAATRAALAETDIALPSFDDEAQVWGDADPAATVERLAAQGVGEIAVKNGAGEILGRADGADFRIATPPHADVRDTTGAGDAFNAGYLAARVAGRDPATACGFGQAVAGEVLRCFGALTSVEALAPHAARLKR